LSPNKTYYWMVIPRNVVGPAPTCVTNSFTTVSLTGTITSTTRGGVWSDANTWVGGVVPTSLSDVVIADGATVTIGAAVSANSVRIGTGGTGAVLSWHTTGALTVVTDLTIEANSRFLPHTSTTGQQINIGGNFTNNGYANLAVASTIINFNGSLQSGGRNSFTLNGTGTFEGDTTGGGGNKIGIIRELRCYTKNGGTINTTRNLVAYTLLHISGNLNTNGKLSVSNGPQVYGQAFNRQISNVVVSAMGSGYTSAPVVAPTGSSLWAASTAVALGNVRVTTGGNIYVVHRAGTTGASAPVHTSDSATNGTAGLMWIGNTGTIGSPLVNGSALTTGQNYFIGNKLYVCKGTNTLASGASFRDFITRLYAKTNLGDTAILSGDTLTYVGTPATVSINHDATTSTVRSLNLTNAGSGYHTTAPTFIFLAAAGTSAAGSAYFFQSITGPANAAVTRGTALLSPVV